MRKGGDKMTDAEKKEFLIQFGSRVKKYRERINMTQEELANKIGYNSDNARSSTQKIEAGKTDLPTSRIYMLAQTLGIPVSTLMGWEDNDSNSSPKQTLNRQEQVLLDKFRKLNTNGKLKAIESVSDLTEINKYVNHVYIVKEAGRDGSKDVTVTDEDVEGYYKLETPSDEI